MKILIVDDEIAMREILKIMLKNYVIVEASNGREAIKIFCEERPEVVLMDIMMPLMDGIKATAEIKKIDPNVKIIAITAYATAKGDQILEAGADFILKKPFTRREVIEAIKNVTGKT
ncbi:MAG: response regulator [Archaeoglobales archaeon]|nr:response regulator [Archaeoglobales archaeon]